MIENVMKCWRVIALGIVSILVMAVWWKSPRLLPQPGWVVGYHVRGDLVRLSLLTGIRFQLLPQSLEEGHRLAAPAIASRTPTIYYVDRTDGTLMAYTQGAEQPTTLHSWPMEPTRNVNSPIRSSSQIADHIEWLLLTPDEDALFLFDGGAQNGSHLIQYTFATGQYQVVTTAPFSRHLSKIFLAIRGNSTCHGTSCCVRLLIPAPSYKEVFPMKNSYLDTMKSCYGKTFRRRVGIRRRTFRQVYQGVRRYLDDEQQQKPMSRRGKKSTALSLTEKLLLTFVYLRQYPTFEHLGAMFGVSESYANKLFHRHLDILVQVLRLPGHHALLDGKLQAILLDVTEQPIERPTKAQRQYYSGKKKRHTIKAQLIVCVKSLQILLLVCGKGRTHDFALLKQCRLRINTDLKKYADSGYQGILKLYPNSLTPIKKPRGRDLTKEEKCYNRELAKVRIAIEHVNRRCKIFRIVKETYRGKHTHYHKTWTVVAALVNLRYDHNAQNQGI